MNSRIFKHIVFFILGVFFFSQAQAIPQTVINSVQDDTSQVEERTFDNLKEKYSGNEFIYERTIENSGWWSRFKQWLSDFFKDLFGLTNKGQASKATTTFIRIAGVLLFLFVVFFIFKAIINKEGKWVFGKSSDKSIIPVSDIETNIHSVNFETLISQAEKNNDERLAIRYYYLWLLKGLSEKEFIEYDVEKTNNDYIVELADSKIEAPFSYTSYLYNYIWYGEFQVSQSQYQNAKHAFINLLKTIKA